MKRNADKLSNIITHYLERNSLNQEDPSWKICKSSLGGFGVFARRRIEVGEVIFKDHPVVLGPRAAPTCPLICVTCYGKENLKPCSMQCGLLVCSEQCQESSHHQKECKLIRQWQKEPIRDEQSGQLVKVLTPIRCLLLNDEDKEVAKHLKAHNSDKHGFEVGVMKHVLHLDISRNEDIFMRFMCSVMDANAFEVVVGQEDHQTSVRGLYPLASLVNHSCRPNTMHVFDEDRRMVVRATVTIAQGEEVFHSYTRVIWGTPTRRYQLHLTKHFHCRCPRCRDPTEFGSYIGAVLCKICRIGKLIPVEALVFNTHWECESCHQTASASDVASLTSLLGSTLNTFTPDDLDRMFKLLRVKLPDLVPANNEAVVELKYKIIWILGYSDGYSWTELPDDLISIKVDLCKDLLALLRTLRLGQCKMRGLLLYELYSCFKEYKRRKENKNTINELFDEEMNSLLVETSDILMYDVGAPREVKKYLCSLNG